MRKKKIKKWMCQFFLPLFLLLTGCGSAEKTEIVLTTGFEKDEVFRLDSAVCTRQEAMLYLVNERNRYEAVYGSQIWEAASAGEALQAQLKENVLAEISQVKAMTLMAERRGVALSEEQQRLAAEAAEEYCASFSDEERKHLEISEELAEGMYRDYALADTVYRQIIADINPEVSDDEARVISVQHILIRSGSADAANDFSEAERVSARQTALEVYRAANEGESFELLIEKYHEGEEGTLLIGKGETEAAFETAAFSLGVNEISEIVETSQGFEIIKCLSTFHRDETDRNKLKIVERRRAETFGQEYEAFADSLIGDLNEALWEQLEIPQGEKLTNSRFFEIYKEKFENRTEK